MNEELQDFELESPEPTPPDAGGSAGRPRWPYLVGVIVILLIVVSFLVLRKRPEESEPAPPPPAAEATPPVEEEPTSVLTLGEIPELGESDAWLREIAAQLSSHPKLVEWMLTDELIRRFVVSVDNVAEGISPARHLSVAAPRKGFAAREQGGRVFADPGTYQRYDVLVDVVESLDPRGVTELYRAIRPLCQKAYSDLGYPPEQFDEALLRASQRLLATPVPEGPVELKRKVTAYEFQNPELEALSPTAKQFLRLGPRNLERLQRKVRELVRSLDLESRS